jgi:hypothetical protein
MEERMKKGDLLGIGRRRGGRNSFCSLHWQRWLRRSFTS